MAIVGSPSLGVESGIAPTELPGVFHSKYGRATVQSVSIGAGGSYSIVADPNRTLLSFWGTTGTVTILPDSQGAADISGPSLAPAGTPLILTFASHQQLVMLGWTVTSAAGATVTIIMARQIENVAPPPKKRRICRMR